MKILVTGATGFFGGVLKGHLEKAGHGYVNLDRLADPQDEARGRMAVCDLRDAAAVEAVFTTHGPFDAVCHVAAELAHEAQDKAGLWKSNVDGTRNVAESSRQHGVRQLIFTSTNCLWGHPLNRSVVEDDAPCPVEVYGKSKLAAEEVLKGFASDLNVIIFRSPTIIAPGRVGLLGILFDFIAEGRRLPVVGHGNKPYQFIYADDYAAAIALALEHPASDVFHIGSHHATSLEGSYRYVIEHAGSKSRIYHLPEFPTLPLMRLCHILKISPLGPYQYSMIAEEFVFNTTHLEKTLGWQPTKTNGECLFAAYAYYEKHKHELEANAASLPAHRRKARMGVIRLLKWIS
ncbi:MAG: NAD(P)-dependent oxidoreductase [Verrucomicrobiota bacterium]